MACCRRSLRRGCWTFHRHGRFTSEIIWLVHCRKLIYAIDGQFHFRNWNWPSIQISELNWPHVCIPVVIGVFSLLKRAVIKSMNLFQIASYCLQESNSESRDKQIEYSGGIIVSRLSSSEPSFVILILDLCRIWKG